ncbi:MAG: hypothetical protein AAGA68_27285 [Pseudomonadota bacterium]
MSHKIGQCSPSGVRQEGNNFAHYAIARAAAAVGDLNFAMPRPHWCGLAEAHDLASVLPDVVSRVDSARVDTSAAVELTCSASKKAAHRARDAYSPYVDTSTFHDEVRTGLQAWGTCVGFPKDGDELDDVAIHVRLGDVLATGIYGMVTMPKLLAFIPRHATSVGIITQPFHRSCSESDYRSALPGLSHKIDRDACSCTSAALVDAIIATIKRRYPYMRITLRDQDERLGSYYRLALAPLTSVCQLSSFCRWPTLAAPFGILLGGFDAGDSTLVPFRSLFDFVENHTSACNGITPEAALKWYNTSLEGSVA